MLGRQLEFVPLQVQFLLAQRIEAAALGVPVIANDLPVFREVLGNIPIYANVTDRYLWKKNIEAAIKEAPAQAPDARFVPPDWDAHFKTVLRLT